MPLQAQIRDRRALRSYSAIPASLSATYVGAGRGEGGAGVSLAIWNWTTSAWATLGANSALDSDAAAARTISATPPGNPADYVRDGGVWFLAAALPSSAPPGTIASDLFTDYLELKASYTLP